MTRPKNPRWADSVSVHVLAPPPPPQTRPMCRALNSLRHVTSGELSAIAERGRVAVSDAGRWLYAQVN